MPRAKKTLLFTVIGIIIILMVLFAMLWQHFVRSPIYRQSDTATIIVPPGTGIDYLAATLHRQNLLNYPRLFVLLAKINGDADRLKTGEYEIKTGMTPSELLSDIVAGRVYQRHIIFIEGKTFNDMKQVLNDNQYLKHEITNLTNAQIMQQLGHPEQQPEGLFFPATYQFTWGDSDILLLKKAYAHMQSILNSEWQQRASDLPYHSAYDALIVASLIEKETALPPERAQIAGVIVRRLQKNMRLQVDPTILYGLGLTHAVVITKANLAIDTPYNTYLHFGLPPTPIDMPSHASILAAMHPDAGDTYFYVARGDGSHVFSKTYAGHQKAIANYLRKTPNRLSPLPFCFVQPPLLRPKICY